MFGGELNPREGKGRGERVRGKEEVVGFRGLNESSGVESPGER